MLGQKLFLVSLLGVCAINIVQIIGAPQHSSNRFSLSTSWQVPTGSKHVGTSGSSNGHSTSFGIVQPERTFQPPTSQVKAHGILYPKYTPTVPSIPGGVPELCECCNNLEQFAPTGSTLQEILNNEHSHLTGHSQSQSVHSSAQQSHSQSSSATVYPQYKPTPPPLPGQAPEECETCGDVERYSPTPFTIKVEPSAAENLAGQQNRGKPGQFIIKVEDPVQKPASRPSGISPVTRRPVIYKTTKYVPTVPALPSGQAPEACETCGNVEKLTPGQSRPINQPSQVRPGLPSNQAVTSRPVVYRTTKYVPTVPALPSGQAPEDCETCGNVEKLTPGSVNQPSQVRPGLPSNQAVTSRPVVYRTTKYVPTIPALPSGQAPEDCETCGNVEKLTPGQSRPINQSSQTLPGLPSNQAVTSRPVVYRTTKYVPTIPALPSGQAPEDCETCGNVEKLTPGQSRPVNQPSQTRPGQESIQAVTSRPVVYRTTKYVPTVPALPSGQAPEDCETCGNVEKLTPGQSRPVNQPSKVQPGQQSNQAVTSRPVVYKTTKYVPTVPALPSGQAPEDCETCGTVEKLTPGQSRPVNQPSQTRPGLPTNQAVTSRPVIYKTTKYVPTVPALPSGQTPEDCETCGNVEKFVPGQSTQRPTLRTTQRTTIAPRTTLTPRTTSTQKVTTPRTTVQRTTTEKIITTRVNQPRFTASTTVTRPVTSRPTISSTTRLTTTTTKRPVTFSTRAVPSTTTRLIFSSTRLIPSSTKPTQRTTIRLIPSSTSRVTTTKAPLITSRFPAKLVTSTTTPRRVTQTTQRISSTQRVTTQKTTADTRPTKPIKVVHDKSEGYFYPIPSVQLKTKSG